MSELNVSARKGAVKSVPFAALPHRIAADPRLLAIDKCVLLALLFWARDKDACWPSNESIGLRVGRAPVNVRVALRRIEKTGLIARERVELSDGNRTGRMIRLLWRTAPVAAPKEPTKTAAIAVMTPAESEAEPIMGGPVLDLPIDQLLRARAEHLRSLPYADYLLTSHWRRCRDRALERAGGECAVCKSREGLQVHHRTYDRFGNEADDDLIVLCRPCHELFHKNRRLASPPLGIATSDPAV